MNFPRALIGIAVMVLTPMRAPAATILGSERPTNRSQPSSLNELAWLERLFTELGDDDLDRVSQRDVLVYRLADQESTEVAVLGMAQFGVPSGFFVERFRDIEKFKRGYAVPQIGKFASPPLLSDLAELTFPDQDIRDLKRCREGDCKVQLSAEAMQRFQSGVDWSSPNHAEQASALARQMLLEYVQAYLDGGNLSLARYHDRSNPRSLAREFEALVAASPYVEQLSPDLTAHLRDYPSPSATATDDFLYWSKETFGLKPVVSVTHVLIHPLRYAESNGYVLASKQIYANHYFNASLGFTLLVDVPAPEPRILVVYVNRSRAMKLGGLFSGIRKALIGGRLEASMRESILYTRARLEAIYEFDTKGVTAR